MKKIPIVAIAVLALSLSVFCIFAPFGSASAMTYQYPMYLRTDLFSYVDTFILHIYDATNEITYIYDESDFVYGELALPSELDYYDVFFAFYYDNESFIVDDGSIVVDLYDVVWTDIDSDPEYYGAPVGGTISGSTFHTNDYDWQTSEDTLSFMFRSNIDLAEYNKLNDELDAYKAMEDGVGAIEIGFGAIGRILNIEILPKITIGTILSVPLILGVVFLVLRLVRGE